MLSGWFVAFVGALRRDLAGNPEQWENRTLDDFLEALSAWTEGSPGYYENHGRPTPGATLGWRSVAEMFNAAKFSE